MTGGPLANLTTGNFSPPDNPETGHSPATFSTFGTYLKFCSKKNFNFSFQNLAGNGQTIAHA
jgi:hypothetical protein